MPERYIDPNSGAAPQPGGYSGPAPVLADPDSATASTAPVSDPEEAAKVREQSAKDAASLESAGADNPSVGPNDGQATEVGDGPKAEADQSELEKEEGENLVGEEPKHGEETETAGHGPKQAPGTAQTEPPSRVGDDGVPVLENQSDEEDSDESEDDSDDSSDDDKAETKTATAKKAPAKKAAKKAPAKKAASK